MFYSKLSNLILYTHMQSGTKNVNLVLHCAAIAILQNLATYMYTHIAM